MAQSLMAVDDPLPPDAILTLSVKPFIATPTGLRVEGYPSYEAWEAYGQGLQMVEGCIHFLIGDWLEYGERVFDDAYAQALDKLPYAKQTLQNDKFVASHIPPERRRSTLSHGHHSAVAALPEAEQEYWLDKAEQGEWTRQELRDALRYAKDERSAFEEELRRLRGTVCEMLGRAPTDEDAHALQLVLDVLDDRLSKTAQVSDELISV
jgi:hypothetical protein